MEKQSVVPIAQTPVLELLPPYPIVLVTTQHNIITINQTAYFTFRPLRIGIAVAHTRHSHGLVRAEREFVINIPGESLIEAVKVCGSVSGSDGDKFEASGLSRELSQAVRAISIAECGAHIECRVVQELDFEDRTWFIGEVVAARKAEDHNGTAALMCGRHEYMLPGETVADR